jgi:hypothetical protein
VLVLFCCVTKKNSQEVTEDGVCKHKDTSELKVISLQIVCINCWQIKSDVKYDARCIQDQNVTGLLVLYNAT